MVFEKNGVWEKKWCLSVVAKGVTMIIINKYYETSPPQRLITILLSDTKYFDYQNIWIKKYLIYKEKNCSWIWLLIPYKKLNWMKVGIIIKWLVNEGKKFSVV